MTTNLATLQDVGRGIMARTPRTRRARVGHAVFARVYAGLCESEYTYRGANGEAVLMWMRWSNPSIHVPHYIVYGTPVELDGALEPEAIIYDGPESM